MDQQRFRRFTPAGIAGDVNIGTSYWDAYRSGASSRIECLCIKQLVSSHLEALGLHELAYSGVHTPIVPAVWSITLYTVYRALL